MKLQFCFCLLALCAVVSSQSLKQNDLKRSTVNTSMQIETDNAGVLINTTNSLRAGPRGYVLLEDTVGRKKLFHLDHERQPERVVHALGHGAYGSFESYGDWSNLTSACFLKQGVKSDVFTRFSVVVASLGGSEVGRDVKGFATKVYSECGNHDFIGNNIPSFFINDGILFPDLVHAVKAEPDKGFPTGGSAHDTAFDFFTKRPEGAFEFMNVLSGLGVPRSARHMGAAGVHTFRMINDQGNSTLFKWYWSPVLGHRSFADDESTKIAGKNANYQRIDLYNAIEAGNFPQWEFTIQLFPDDGSYMYKSIDLLDPTQVVPFELSPPIKLGKLTLNRNPTSFFAEPESIGFNLANAVKGLTFVPDPVLQWRLISYDDAQNHRAGSPNHYLLPVNRPIVPINNNYRDGNMQPLLYAGASASTPNNLNGVQPSSENIPYGSEIINGRIGRYEVLNDYFSQPRAFWYTLDAYAQQHVVDGYRFQLGHTSAAVAAAYIAKILNPIDNCLARRVAYGIGSPLPALGTGSTQRPNATYPSLYPLASNVSLSVQGLAIGILADELSPSTSDLSTLSATFTAQKLTFEVIAPHQGPLGSGIVANQSYVTTSGVFYDALIVTSTTSATNNPSQTGRGINRAAQDFLREAYGHGKPLGELGDGGVLAGLGFAPAPGLFVESSAEKLAADVVGALTSPGRYWQRGDVDDAGICE